MLNRITLSQLWCGCGRLTIRSYRKYSTETTIQKFIKVAIIGAPNAGKSTLVNSLVGNRVCAVTHIANTTRSHLNGVLTIDDTQLVLTDTPGTVPYMEGRRLKMHSNHMRTPKRVTASADLIAVVTDVSNKRTKNYIEEEVLNIMDEYKEIPAVLIMNKIDRLKSKTELILLTSILTNDRKKDEWGYLLHGGSERFLECFFTDARTGEGSEQFLSYLLSVAKPGEWEYSDQVYCDSSVEALINEVFREKLLVMFGQEIPWQVKQETVLIDAEFGYVRIHQKLIWPRKSQQKYVTTKEDELKEECLKELEKMFKCPVQLSLDISQKKNMKTDDLVYY